MTDNEIIKAFEICYTDDEEDCLNCPFCDEDGECMDKGDSKLLEEVGNLLNRQKAEIERCKGVIKILENDVKVANIEAVKNFAHFLIDRSKGGEIEVVDVADLAVEYMNTFGGNKDEQL